MSILSQQAPKHTQHKRNLVVIILAVFSVLLLASGGSAYWIYTTGLKSSTPASFSASLHTPKPVDTQVEVRQVANQYMKALLAQDYKTMWSLLNPQIQQDWGDEAAFANFLKQRFQAYNLQGFTLTGGGGLTSWTNPESMQSFQHVQQIRVSLQLQPKHTSQIPQVPEALQPDQVYQNLPFIVQQLPTSPASKVNAQWMVLDGGPADPEAPILPATHPALQNVNVPILMYHHISNIVPTDILAHSLTVDTKNFVQQLDYLQKHHYHTITFNQLFNTLYYKAPLPQNPIILTFDDGYTDAYTWALPELKKHGFSATFFIISGVIGWKGYMGQNQLKSLLSNGMQIGSHTVHHVDMGQLVNFDPKLAQKELVDSKAKLEKELGGVIQEFCYPSGEPFRSGSIETQKAIVAMLAKDGYIGATTDPGLTGYIQSSNAPFDLLRIRMDGRDPALGFTQQLP